MGSDGQNNGPTVGRQGSPISFLGKISFPTGPPQPFTQGPAALASPLPPAENSVNSLPVINSSECQISNCPGPRATNLSATFPAARFSLTFLEHWGWAARPVPSLKSLEINSHSFIHSFIQQIVTAHFVCQPHP